MSAQEGRGAEMPEGSGHNKPMGVLILSLLLLGILAGQASSENAGGESSEIAAGTEDIGQLGSAAAVWTQAAVLF